MADENTSREQTGTGRGPATLTDQPSPPRGSISPPPFEEGPTLRLAHDHKVTQSAAPAADEQCEVCKVDFEDHAGAQVAAAGDDAKHEFKRPGFELPWHRPVTVDGHVNIGMGLQVFFPSLAEQKAGFTPFYLDEQGKQQNATKIVLENFLGIYKSFEPKREEKARLEEGAAGVGITEGAEGQTGTTHGTARVPASGTSNTSGGIAP